MVEAGVLETGTGKSAWLPCCLAKLLDSTIAKAGRHRANYSTVLVKHAVEM
jgi:hypothetical protein